ncbi:hypothetical protein F3Y22_tig00001095pilonHSYRG00036 [Hibiscus syriacus]|uniref:Uncharacterized protein n=1 Tax=Hibiscus syriacus TaxID=106335 RepID=A0A6A3D2U7_HIBSY|nr:hypothetical protein F3Y22_tig00001095pilonHSYRG00036 [Hibiscus syriacus]
MLDRLATMDRLRHFGVEVDGLCALCKMEEESRITSSLSALSRSGFGGRCSSCAVSGASWVAVIERCSGMLHIGRFVKTLVVILLQLGAPSILNSLTPSITGPQLLLYNSCNPTLISEWLGVMGLCFDPNVVVYRGKRKLRSLFWKVRAEIKRRVKGSRKSKQKFSFHYDPFSYALNFDNGNFGFLC